MTQHALVTNLYDSLRSLEAPYALVYSNEIISPFQSAFSARLYAQGMALNGFAKDSSSLNIWSRDDKCFILIEHLLQTA